MQPQPPERKQLRKQDFSANCYFTGGCRLGTAPHFAPENLGGSGRMVGKPYLGITSRLPVTRPK